MSTFQGIHFQTIYVFMILFSKTHLVPIHLHQTAKLITNVPMIHRRYFKMLVEMGLKDIGFGVKYF